MLSRRLVLKREALAELASDELRAVAGGQIYTNVTCVNCFTIHACIEIHLTYACPRPRTLDCPTLAC